MTPQDAQAYCTAVTQRSGSNFYYSFFFLPRDRREAMYTVYAFCKEVDSVVDEPSAGADPATELVRWREELTACYRGQPTRPVTISLARHIKELGIPQLYFDELINGVEMDLIHRRYATFKDLYQYCYRVASVVGLICLHIFGTRSPEAKNYAVNLGIAFQLTNILRDIGNDADRGRVYLPQEDLRRFGYREEDLMHRRHTAAFVELMRYQCARAERYYAVAHRIVESLPPSDRSSLTVAEIMRAVYVRILGRIEASEYQVFGPRISLPPSYRLALAGGVWLRSWFPHRSSASRSAS